jgi:hypothetical protein
MYFDGILMVNKCISKNTNIFECFVNVFECFFSVFECIFNAFECIYNVIQCISNVLIVYLRYISMCFNEFTYIVIGISPSHSCYNIFAVRIHLHICFSLSTMTTFLTCSTIILFSPIPIDPF